MDVSQISGTNNGYLWVLCSFTCFVCSNFVLGLFVPKNAHKTTHHVWKWKNIANSFIHSFISGLWAMLCFWQVPEMKDDLINNYSVSAQGVISFSVGYFIYDFIDMAIHDRKRSFDLLIHHCLVILCFSLSVTTCYYQGYSLLALLVEVNSIFLHLRQLMLLQGFQKTSSFYQVNGILNLVTFIIFRVFTMGGMFQWLLSHRGELSATVFGLGVFSLAMIMGMNFQLLSRVLKSDYRKRPQSVAEASDNVGILQPQLHPSQSHSEKFVDSELKTAQKAKVVPTIDADFVSGITCGEILKLD